MKLFLTWFAVLAACGSDVAPTGGDDDDDDEIPELPNPPAVYVAKVKNLLVGLPPTADEIATVEANPAAFESVIEGWMTQPEYEHKMRDLFSLAFQQTQIGPTDFNALIPNRGLGPGPGTSRLTQNVRESFARTMLQLQREGRPLTEAFTTKRLMMTPALMALYAFLDTRVLDNDGEVTDRLALSTPITLTDVGPIPLAETLDPTSPRFMHWYAPDLASINYPLVQCEGRHQITFAADSLLLVQMLLGAVPEHAGGPNGRNCPPRAGSAAHIQFSATDFTEWKMVTIRRPVAGEPISTFFDIPALRGASELVLRTPRPGFFSTPAFFANWPTNADNQHRVTLNQAMIVATGRQIDGSDPTIPTETPGLDTAHATGGCVACHQLLDPMRSIFSSTYSWFGYPQTDPDLQAQPGQFAFHGVIAPMATLDDFGALLADHPLVAEAWTQKLCYYANSAPCDPQDPELQRIVGELVASNMSWNVLVRELMASPITTHAIVSARPEVISVVRRDHLCTAIDRRLGFTDVCQLAIPTGARRVSTIGKIVAGLPSDGYGRGATTPVLPNEPTLFYRAGLENICIELAAQVVDGAPDRVHPAKRVWASTDPGTAIADFVTTLLALVPGDPRHAPATDALTRHFADALATGASPTDSLRSVFVAACLSPSFIGLGL